MKRLIPDTTFGRLFGLLAVALLLSYLITSVLIFAFPGAHPPPPPPFGRPHPPEHPPGFWIGLTIQFIALTIAAWYGARLLAQPIQDLALGAERLGGNLNSPPMDETGPAEARQAAHVFNRMQDRIRGQLEERTRFLAAVSHDLRTPLTRMKLRVEQMPDNPHAGKLSDDIAEMAAMLDATLEYLRGGAQTEPWQRLDIQALVDTMADDAMDSGQDVTVQGHARPIMAQPGTLRRCLSNLIDNALRYGYRATIRLIDGPRQLVIEIHDAGPGIPENKMAAVFEPFVRLETSRNRNTGGVGLGLAIAREVAARHGGELTLKNAPEGGLIARLTLPREM